MKGREEKEKNYGFGAEMEDAGTGATLRNMHTFLPLLNGCLS
jgi:hypothetical protein